MCDEFDVREMFDRLHSEESFQEIGAIGNDAMIRHKDCFVAAYERPKARGNFARTCGGVLGEWDCSESHDALLAKDLVESFAGAGETGGNRRMGVDDCRNIMAHLVDCEVHSNLAGHLTGADEELALRTDGAL